MRSSLLDYEPEIYHLLPAPALSAQAEELASAAELLERLDRSTAGVVDEAYIVELIDKAVADAAPGRPRLSRPTAGALAHVLGVAAQRVLRPGRAARIGAMGRLFALELEGLSPEDQLFEVSRQFVRLIRESARRAVPLDERRMRLNLPAARTAAASALAARRAVHAAAVELAPGLVSLVATPRGLSSASAWASPAQAASAGGATASSSVPLRRIDIASSRRVRSFEGV
ncbi:MAG: hypothetical protein KF788_15455 [Piscinibacter sp.]|nr:hypothetical protein [Piscinibacter sp.]